MARADDEDDRLRSVALQNATSIVLARERAEAELVRTREALRQSQERLTAALSAAGTGTFRWDLRTNAVEWDANLDQLLGLSPGPRQSLETLVAAAHPDDRASVRAGYERCLHHGADLDVEFRVLRPDHSSRWIHAKAKTMVGHDGQSQYVTGACADVTERREAADALRRSEERLRAMFAQAAVGIAVAELGGRFIDVNRKFADILGYSASELQQLTFTDITHPDDRAATESFVSQMLAGTIREYSLEKRYLRKDQSLVWSLTTVTLLHGAAGDPERFLGVIEDVTARKHAEEALREETRVLELLNTTGQTVAAKLELNELLQAVTDAATELSGAKFGAFFYTTTDDNGDALLLYTLSGASREAFDGFGKPRATALFGPTFRGEAPIRIDDVLTDARYGTMAPHHGMPRGHLPVRSYLAVPVRSRSGDVLGGLFFGHPSPGVFTDRTERLVLGVAAQAGIAIDNARLFETTQSLLDSERTARSTAERMSNIKDEFLATLSHELRTPLNAILGWSTILRTAGGDRPDLQKGLDTIQRNAQAQAQLIEDLLDMSRITAGKVRLDVQPISPVSAIEGALSSIEPAADAKGIRIEKVLDPLAGPISGDAGRLQQIIWNLLSNAIKFTPRDGKVQVVLERVNSHVEISVADTGIGIQPELIPQLFERFRQGDASTTRQHGGLGLGLSIVKSLTELHGGTVAVESAGPGCGTTVSVSLPLSVVHRAAVPPDRLHPRATAPALAGFAQAELSGVTVLVVDDHADALELIQRVLEDCAARVITAGAAAQALELVEHHRPDVLLTDIGMPGMDGYELLRRVRALGALRGGKVPAIALTAFARSEDRTRALRAGFAVHMAKPVDPSELVATVASVAGRVGQET